MSGNTFGKLFTLTTSGESHGAGYLAIIDGCPPGMALSEADIQVDLDRRKPAKSRHVTQRKESDSVEITSGIFEGVTTGTPIGLLMRIFGKDLLNLKFNKTNSYWVDRKDPKSKMEDQF